MKTKALIQTVGIFIANILIIPFALLLAIIALKHPEIVYKSIQKVYLPKTHGEEFGQVYSEVYSFLNTYKKTPLEDVYKLSDNSKLIDNIIAIMKLNGLISYSFINNQLFINFLK